MGKLLIISNRLPISLTKNAEGVTYTKSPGGLATSLSSVYQSSESLWIGWPGIEIAREEEQKVIAKELAHERMYPVFLTREDADQYYEGFSNDTLWPLFHYSPQLTSFHQQNWAAYQRVNEKFCAEILKVADEHDTIWIHDYHLFLLPAMLREKLPGAKIGFFQHIPFPSYEIFRILPWREEILRGIVGADLIGFQTYDDSRHFLSTVSRIISIPNSDGYLQIGYRFVKVESFPISIDYQLYEHLSMQPEVIAHVEEFRHIFNDRKLILSVDRLDLSKGIPEKLRAYEVFLEANPALRGTHNLILLVVPSRIEVENYKNLKWQIEQQVGRINGKYGHLDWTPIRYMFTSLPLESISALYKMADIALVTPLRDGMNLVAKEYLASKTDSRGVLILSEMAGAAKELSDALLVNPHDANGVAEAIQMAFDMPVEEQVKRNRIMQKQLKRNDVHRWAGQFIEKLGEVKQKQKQYAYKQVSGAVAAGITRSFRHSKNRILFLDYDGTLMSFFVNPSDARPDQALESLLLQLAAMKNTELVIISGRDKTTLGEWLGHLPLNLIAEHGTWMKEAGKDWECLVNTDAGWKQQFASIFTDFTDRTPGTFIEEKDHSLVWHYRRADPEFGLMRARELVSNLEYLSINKNLQILEGNKVLELKVASINKGVAASRWLRKSAYDFILAIGDDYTDEDTFKQMPDHAITIKVGSGSSVAAYRIDTDQHVRQFLHSLLTSSMDEAQPQARQEENGTVAFGEETGEEAGSIGDWPVQNLSASDATDF